MSGTLGGGPSIIIRVSANTSQAQAAFESLKAQTKALNDHFATLDANMRNMDRTMRYILAFGIGSVTQQFVHMIGEMERLNTSLVISEKTFDNANEKLNQIILVARNAPVSLGALTKAFQQMSAAGIKDLVDKNGNGLLKNLSDAIAAFGGGDENFKLASLALTQIQGKGVVMLEELKRQLGEQIPTAIRLLAEGLNVPLSELFRMIERGQVDAETFFKIFNDGLERTVKGAAELRSNTFLGSIQQLKTEIESFALTLAKSGALDPFTAGIKLLTEALRRLGESITTGGINDAINSFFLSITNNADYLSRMVVTLQSFGNAIGALFQVIIQILGQLSPEAMTGGIVGFIFFGAKGAVLGAMIGQAHDLFESVARIIGGIAQAIVYGASAIGASVENLATMGAIGWFFFGRAGLVAGALIGYANDLVNGVSTAIQGFVRYLVGVGAYFSQSVYNLAHPLDMSSPFAAANKAMEEFKQARDQMLQQNAAAGRSILERIGIVGPNESPAAIENKINSISNSIQTMVRNVQEARKKFENAFSSPDLINGLDTASQNVVQKFSTWAEQLNVRVTRATQGQGAAILEEFRNHAKQMENVYAKLNEGIAQALASGDTRKAASLQKELESVSRSMAEAEVNARKLAETIDGRIGRQASAAIARFEVNLNKIAEQLDTLDAQYSGGKKMNEEYQMAKAREQFGQITAQLEKMRIAVMNTKAAEASRFETLQQIDAMQNRVNETMEKAIAVLARKAQREREDAQIGIDRTLEDSTRRLQEMQLRLSPFGDKMLEQLSTLRQYEDAVRDTTDKIRQFTRAMEDAGGPGRPMGQMFVEPIKQLEAMKVKFEQLRDAVKNGSYYLAQASKQFWDAVGNSVERGLGDTLTALVMRTGRVRDALVSMYSDITKAAMQYILKFMLIKTGLSSDGSLGGIFGTLLGGIGGLFGGSFSSSPGSFNMSGGVSTDALMSFNGSGSMFLRNAKGNAFWNGAVQRFANGGILTGPAAFPLGLAGEAGPEAILPLDRGPDGKLGLKGGRGDTYNIHIRALDAPSVRELLIREGRSIIQSMQHRARINRGYQAVG